MLVSLTICRVLPPPGSLTLATLPLFEVEGTAAALPSTAHGGGGWLSASEAGRGQHLRYFNKSASDRMFSAMSAMRLFWSIAILRSRR